MIILGLSGIGVIALSFCSISNDYIYLKFQKTQYSKICWFFQKCEQGGFSDCKYNGLFIGSSQVYYGINDSILGPGYLNLGFNTPSRDMDLFVLETFFESGGNAENIFLGVGGDKIVYYGLHPLMPYLVSPAWLLKHGQKWYSLHFWKFVIIRSQKVLESLLSLKEQNIIEFKSKYGVGYLDRTTRRRKPYDSVLLQKNRFNCQEKVNSIDEIRYNINSQWSFFEQIKSKHNPIILILPSYMVANNFDRIQQFTQKNEHLKGLKVVGLNEISIDIIEKQENWADPGHLNTKGGVLFAERLKTTLRNEN